jgi:hypothetical protein
MWELGHLQVRINLVVIVHIGMVLFLAIIFCSENVSGCAVSMVCSWFILPASRFVS